ncbi:MAG TPA: HEAT repeat domain-containing protein [Phycisphaerae bacterium]|nr:HEAT repeat domain-containing protein [Phycisphaerae bacterium]
MRSCKARTVLLGALILSSGCVPEQPDVDPALPKERQAELYVDWLRHIDPHVTHQGRQRLREIGAAAVPALIQAMNDRDARVRAASAQVLGYVRDIRALWPLTLAAATDESPGVRHAAASAVTWLGPEPNSAMHSAFRRCLLEQTLSIRYEGVPLKDAIQDLSERGGTNVHTNLGALELIGIGPEDTIIAEANDVTLAEAWCRVLVATGKPVTFQIEPPIYVSSVEALTRLVEERRQRKARRAKLRRLAQRTESGREVWQRLQTPVREARFDGMEFSSVLQFLAQAGKVEIQADWPALDSVGIKRSLRVTYVQVAAPGAGLVKGVHRGPVALETLLWLVLADVGGGTELEFIVEDGGVFISTRKVIDERLKRRK